ncbi:hypothetical protein ABXV18_27090 [Vibrio owensii]|uniref:hypothetical protein n=1 Tax=Vibrio owensii TaxID=696485 RepID=UPI0033959769
MEKFTSWVFKSDTTKSFYITTHVNFHGKSKQWIKENIPTWKRPNPQQIRLNLLAAQDDFTIETNTVQTSADMKAICQKLEAQGYAKLNKRVALIKNLHVVA